MKETKTPSRVRQAKFEQGQRDKGRVQRKRWAHPDDWPAIDAYISERNTARDCGK